MYINRKILLSLLGLTSTFIISNSFAIQPQSLASLEALIKKGNYQQAYQVSQQLLTKYEGDSNFDVLYGIAAQETHHPDEAYFAFERVLMVKPRDYQARFELAKTHLDLREPQAAQQQLEILQKQPIDSNLRQQVDKYLTVAGNVIAPPTWVTNGGITFDVGYDDNTNSANTIDRINTIYGTATIDRLNQRQASYFQNLFITGGFSKQFNAQHSWYGYASINDHNNYQAHAYDTTSLDLTTGYKYTKDKASITVPVQLQHFLLDKSSYVTVYSIGSELNYELTPKLRPGVFAEYSKISYRQPLYDILDHDLYVAGLSTSYLITKLKTAVTGKVYYERQYANNMQPTADQYSNDTYGVSLLAQSKPLDPLTTYALAKYEYSKYDAASTVTGVFRGDRYLALGVGGKWSINQHWSINLDTSYMENSSNIELYQYRRYLIGTGLTYQF